MPSYVVEEYYLPNMPQTFLQDGLASRGIAEHWTAGGTGRNGARDSADYLASNPSINASYHEIRWWEPATKSYGVLLIVRNTNAAHSMNPTPPTWSPNAEVRRILGNRVGDPNANSYATSFAGMPADLDAALNDNYFVECEVRRRKELLAQETTITDPKPFFNHGWGQPTTRYDAGDRLIPLIYKGLNSVSESLEKIGRWDGPLVTVKPNTDARGAWAVKDNGPNASPRFTGGRNPKFKSNSLHIVKDEAYITVGEKRWKAYQMAPSDTAAGLWVDVKAFIETQPRTRMSMY